MSQAAVSLDASGRLCLSGVLDYRSGAALRSQGQQLIKGSSASQLLVDCSAVSKSSSVGVSLLLGFMRDAAQAGKPMKVSGLPRDMAQIADVSGVRSLFDIQD